MIRSTTYVVYRSRPSRFDHKNFTRTDRRQFQNRCFPFADSGRTDPTLWRVVYTKTRLHGSCQTIGESSRDCTLVVVRHCSETIRVKGQTESAILCQATFNAPGPLANQIGSCACCTIHPPVYIYIYLCKHEKTHILNKNISQAR